MKSCASLNATCWPCHPSRSRSRTLRRTSGGGATKSVFRKLFAPILGMRSDAQTLSLAAEIGTYFHAHIDVGVRSRDANETGPGSIPPSPVGAPLDPPLGEETPIDSAIVESLERWRRRFRLRPGSADRRAGLPSASWSSVSGPERAIAHRAIYADLTCLAVDRDHIAEL